MFHGCVVSHIATQLDISNLECLPQYLERSITHWGHASEIQQSCGYRDFNEQPGHWQLVRWLYGHTWVGTESPSILFDLVTVRLVEYKILLPGVTVLERLVVMMSLVSPTWSHPLARAALPPSGTTRCTAARSQYQALGWHSWRSLASPPAGAVHQLPP